MKNLLKRYRSFLLLCGVYAGLGLLLPGAALDSLRLSGENLAEMLGILPPVFILLGLLDVWVPRETIMGLMGERSGLRGILLAFMLGSFAAGPLYAAFPVAGVLLKKGSRLFNVLIFIGAWSTTKIPMLVFEASAMGTTFMLVRFLANIPVILLIAWLTERLLTPEEQLALQSRAQAL